MLAQGKKQLAKPPQGKQSQSSLRSRTRAFPTLRLQRAISKPLRVRRKKVRYRLCAEKGRHGKPAPLPCFLQRAGHGRTDRSLQGIFRKEADTGEKPSIRKLLSALKEKAAQAGTRNGQRSRTRQGGIAMKPEIKKLLILNAPYLLFLSGFLDKAAQAARLSPGLTQAQAPTP